MSVDLKRYITANKEVQEEVKLKTNVIAKLEAESYKTIQQLDR